MLSSIAKNLSTIFDYLPGNVYLYDIEGNLCNCNLRQAKALGFRTIDEAVGICIYDILPKYAGETIKQNNAIVIDTMQPQTFKEFVPDENGNLFQYLSNKVPVLTDDDECGILGISIKLNDKNAALNYQELLYRDILNQIPSPIYWRNKEGVILGCNKTQAEAVGFQVPEQMIGLTAYDTLTKEQADEISLIDQKVMETQKVVTVEETVGIDSQRTYLSTKQPLFDLNRNVAGVLGISIDITDQKKLEQLEKEQTEILIKALQQQLKTAELVSATIAHEVRTPMLSIGMAASAMQAMTKRLTDKVDEEVTEKFSDKLSGIKNDINKINEFINMILLNVKELKTAAKTQCSMKECVQDAVARFPYNVDTDRELIHIDEMVDFAFMGDKSIMIHILFNLIKNALYFIRKAGKGEVTISSKVTENGHQLIFKDTGTGIKEEHMNNIFDGFYTTTDVGSGVGLSFCKMAVEKFSGTIFCESVEGEFTTFIIELPKA